MPLPQQSAKLFGSLEVLDPADKTPLQSQIINSDIARETRVPAGHHCGRSDLSEVQRGGSFGLGVVPTSMKNPALRKDEASFVQLVLSRMRCHSASAFRTIVPLIELGQ